MSQFRTCIDPSRPAVLLIALILGTAGLARAQSPEPIGEFVGSAFIVLGMPMNEAIDSLRGAYTVRQVNGVEGVYNVYRQNSNGNETSVAWLTEKGGKVAVIGLEWTPSTRGAGPLAEALLDILARLTTRLDDRWHVADRCSVNVTEDAPVSPDERVKMATIICGPRRVNITITKRSSAQASVDLQLQTGSIEP